MPLRDAELAALTAGLPDLQQVGHYVLTPFEVVRLPTASVLWINDRWFEERGLLVSHDAEVRRRVEHWLLSEAAITVLTSEQHKNSQGRLVAYADRYGDARGTSPHGGSGRVATRGVLQIKGIGQTPLVGHATWVHSHGLVNIYEAVCEAIFAEVLNAELPYGALSVLAIVDAGEDINFSESGDQRARRALLVRPAVIRPAHMLRAPLFPARINHDLLGPGTDARRTYETIEYVSTISEREREALRWPSSLCDYCKRLATQAAHADVLRLYSGGMFPSNVSLDGSLLDFGVARAMDNWFSVRLHAHARGFGHDVDRIAHTEQAVRFYAKKARRIGDEWFTEECGRDRLQELYSKTVQELLGRIWADALINDKARARLRDTMRAYFDAQQRIQVRERWDGRRAVAPWLYDTLISKSDVLKMAPLTVELRLAQTIRAILAGAGSVGVNANCWRTAVRMLSPRTALNRDEINKRVAESVSEASPRKVRANLRTVIDESIGASRRWWASCPATLGVKTQRLLGGCSALEVVEAESGSTRWWLEGLKCGARFLWGRSELSDLEIRQMQPKVEGSRWYCEITQHETHQIFGEILSLAPQMAYEDPPEWWTETPT